MRSDLHELLKTWRKDCGLSQSDVASRLHVTRQLVSKIERGNRDPRPYELSALLRAYGKAPADLRTRPTNRRKVTSPREVSYRTINLDRYDPAYAFLSYELADRIDDHIDLVQRSITKPLCVWGVGDVPIDPTLSDRRLGAIVAGELAPLLSTALRKESPDLLEEVNRSRIAHVFAAALDGTVSEVYTRDELLGPVIYVNKADAIGRRNYSIAHALVHAVLDCAVGTQELHESRQERICDLAFPYLFLSDSRVGARYNSVKGGATKFTLAHLIRLADMLGASVEATCLALERIGLASRGRWRGLRERNINIAKIRIEHGIPAPRSNSYGPKWLAEELREAPVDLAYADSKPS